jgi:tetratricopeptide (TPR) repeat protein
MGLSRLIRTAALALSLAAASFSAPVSAQDQGLKRARTALALGKYDVAEKELAKVQGGTAEKLYLQTRVELWTGRYVEAAKTAAKAAQHGIAAKVKLAPWHAEALARQGKQAAAIKVLRAVESEAGAHRARMKLGELLIRSGKRVEADVPLRAILSAWQRDEIKDDDAEGLSIAGRAASLLRMPKNANNLFNKAEKAGASKRVETLLWRAELYLDKYDPGHAGAVVRDAMKLAADDPRVQVARAKVKLAQTMDFALAEEHVNRALAVDGKLSEAYFVRAGLALRTMDIEAAMKAVDAGLAVNANDLELLSMKAAARFLAEDNAGFDALEKQVLALNPKYSSFYSIVGEYAEWEHRYDDIVKMMRKAVAVDPGDSKALAQLGVNLIRAGDDKAGLVELNNAWGQDKFNVRVFNTLNLYEKTIANDYVTVDGTTFRIRYHKEEKAILERYVPKMLDAAWGSMVKRYGFKPKVPVGIELYADSQSFSIRTSGLPNIGIQGVCFGQTLAALSPGAGSFNWGMVLWHELAHVFHIQLSKNRVPRWFTEGLAEYETIIVRDEWRREEHRALFFGLRDGKIPKVASFNRAFTHVDSSRDVVMAYFAASQISVFLAEEFGFDKVVSHLPGWASGKSTPEVVQQSLGILAGELDRRYRAWLKKRLARYDKQFVPDLNPPKSVEAAREAVAKDPKNTRKKVKLALALFAAGKTPEAVATLKLSLRENPKEPLGLYVKLRLALGKKELDEADKIIKQLLSGGGDGYAVRMKAADLAELRDDMKKMKKHLFKAHTFDPVQAEPLGALYDLASKGKDEQGQLWALRKLAQLEQHDRRVWGRLLELLVKRGHWDEAVKVGESAIYIDVANAELHWLYARALARSGRHVSAIYELNSALVTKPSPEFAAKIYKKMAEGYRKLGKKDYATKAEEFAAHMAALAPTKRAAEHEH